MIKIGIIGSGFGLYGLLPAFNSITKCRVISICGKKTNRLVNYCQSINLTKIYSSWQEMLDKSSLDAVAIAVPPNIQYQIAKFAIIKGLHVFAEKPLAANLEQAKELLDLAKRKKIIHAIDFLFPEIDEWQEVKQIIDKKKLGRLKQISLNWDFLSYDIRNKISSWKTNNKEGGGALSFYFSHSLYYLEYFAGKIISLQSLFSYSPKSLNGGEVGINLILKFKDDVTGYAHFCCNTPGLNKHQLIFIFEKGTIILENVNSILTNFVIKIYTDAKISKISLSKKTRIKLEDERVRIVKKLASRFIQSIIHNQKFTPSFYNGVRVQELIKKIKEQQLS